MPPIAKKNSSTIAVAIALLCAPALAQAGAQPIRCAPLNFASNGEFRNVTEPGDVRILPVDKVVLINKRKPEPTRVIFDRATKSRSSVIVVKDCSGTARDFVVTISGEIDAGEVTIDGNYGSWALRRAGDRWMIQ
jgi:hypothetical protein